jgi:hypothetical protein
LEFLDTFSKKDVANDEQLRTLVEEVRGLLNRSRPLGPLKLDTSSRADERSAVAATRIAPCRGR